MTSIFEKGNWSSLALFEGGEGYQKRILHFTFKYFLGLFLLQLTVTRNGLQIFDAILECAKDMSD